MNTAVDLADFLGNNPTVVVVHSPRAATAEPAKRGPRGPPRSSIDPRNYLMSGGTRAMDKEKEKQQAQLAREKVKELKTASTALASELLRTRQESEREISALRDDMLELTSRFKAEQERIALLKQRLAEEGKVRSELEEAHQERVRELHKRLQAEHLLRVNAESGLAKSQDACSAAEAQAKTATSELAGVQAQLTTLQDTKLEAELALNKERRAFAEAQAALESLKIAHERERSGREVAQRRAAELEGTVKGLSDKNSSLFEDLKAAETALQAAKEAKIHMEGTALHHKEEIRVLQEQLDSQKKGRAMATEEIKRLQQRVVELEAAAAVYIAKEAHYDDLKEEYDELAEQDERTRRDLERAKADVRSLMDKLESANSKVESTESLLKQRDAEARQLREQVVALEDAQAAAKLLMATVKDKEAAMTELQTRLAEAQGSVDALKQGREELLRVMQDKDEHNDSLRSELRAQQEELGLVQRRYKQLQGEAEAAELDISRRDLKIKELTDTVHTMTHKFGEEQAASAAEKRRMEGVIRSLESRLTQIQSELSSAKEELSALQQAKITTQADLAAAQEECTHLRLQLTEEQSRSSKLRGELAAVSSSHMKEVESKGQVVAEVTARLQAEEAAKVAAEHEVRALKRRVDELETTIAEAQTVQTRTQEAYDSSQAALESMKRKLSVYKAENKNLMSSYDDWLKQMVKSRPGAGPTAQ